jgi:peptidylprolyl isomerase
MNIFTKNYILLPFFLIVFSCDPPATSESTIISMKTTFGEIKIKLYDGTPIHRDNFIKLIDHGFYDGVSFHRVIKDFMIQAGDPATKSNPSPNQIDSLNTYTLPSEFMNQYFHKKGALAAARKANNVNPDMRSSGTQFYIVQGTRYTKNELLLAERQINNNIKQSIFNKIIRQTADSIRLTGNPINDAKIQEIASIKMFDYLSKNKDYKFTEDQHNIYEKIGGVPRLDGTYTVFGEVTEGLDVVDRIASVITDTNDKPVTDIKIIKVKVVRK